MEQTKKRIQSPRAFSCWMHANRYTTTLHAPPGTAHDCLSTHAKNEPLTTGRKHPMEVAERKRPRLTGFSFIMLDNYEHAEGRHLVLAFHTQRNINNQPVAPHGCHLRRDAVRRFHKPTPYNSQRVRRRSNPDSKTALAIPVFPQSSSSQIRIQSSCKTDIHA